MTSTLLKTANGTEVKLEHRYLSNAFCEKAKAYYRNKKNLCTGFAFNTYFTARAIETYIIDNNLQPEYE